MTDASAESPVEMFCADVDNCQGYITTLPKTYEGAVQKVHRLFRIHQDTPVRLLTHYPGLSEDPLIIDQESWPGLYAHLKRIEAAPVGAKVPIDPKGFKDLYRAYVTREMTIRQFKVQVSDLIGCSSSDLRVRLTGPIPTNWLSDDRTMEDIKRESKYSWTYDYLGFTVEKLSSSESSSNSAPQAA